MFSSSSTSVGITPHMCATCGPVAGGKLPNLAESMHKRQEGAAVALLLGQVGVGQPAFGDGPRSGNEPAVDSIGGDHALWVGLCTIDIAWLWMGTWCSGITPAQHAGGPGLNPHCLHMFTWGLRR